MSFGNGSLWGSLRSGNFYYRGRYYLGIFIGGSLLSGNLYRGVVNIGGSLLSGHRYYRGVVTIGGSLLSGDRHYTGIVTFAEHKTSSKVDAAELSFQNKRWELVKTALKQ